LLSLGDVLVAQGTWCRPASSYLYEEVEMTKSMMIAGLVVAMLATACGDSQDGAEPARPADAAPLDNADAAGSAATGGLAGTTWMATSVNGEAILADFPTPTIVFEADGRVSGSAGCNDYAGTYAVEGSQITFTVGLTSRRPCEVQQGQQEERFVMGLVKAVGFQIGDGVLTLTDADGAAVATFDAA
jgi:heat shock protein HslJ